MYLLFAKIYDEQVNRSVEPARADIRFGSIDVLMTNPPFGADIKITDEDVLHRYRDGVAPLVDAQQGDRAAGGWEQPGRGDVAGTAVHPACRAVGQARRGRVGIVLPNGILSNPGPTDEAIRR